ncbi:hypothetical protein [Halorussus amylolyticus]|uniref:hypothetical protein n=1 Tax=Halorussus amylolyticus TaxID=1126242 RepID=UPI00138F6D0B|nr:hypothetical protein [Halorussus amylolyticus]
MNDRSVPRDPEDIFERLFRSGRTNAALSWLLVGVLALVFVESVVEFDRLWMTFVAAAGAVVLVPPVAYRDWRVMLPWELLALALLPILVRGLSGGELGLFAYYLSVAGLALVVTVELHMFTSLDVTHWFAVTFVAMTTMASVAAWAIVRWNFDRMLGTSYLSTNEALMVEFVWVTLAGFAAGVLFDAYFRRRDRQLWRAINGMIRR